ncbi:MAG: type II toxin-antitoxin system MqsA family antitoxin [Candidatus Edwardsbacteria bacterium]|nr:type II toxin-antitoxin system MqsA family antitoxin [Candidatus Edwardsbacteria bacterium]
MKCPSCRSEMVKRKGNYLYTESGLNRITLNNVEICNCKKCGEQTVSIPKIEELHRVIAFAVIKKKERLSAEEIRFLRKYLGWSGKDFAEYMGVAPETVSRWENDKESMGPVADRLLRLIIAQQKPVDSYSLELLREVKNENQKQSRFEIIADAAGWSAKAA